MKNRQLLALAIFLFSILAHNRMVAQTTVNSAITVNTTWTTAGSPYLVGSSAAVNATATLTIEPGVVVKFTGQYDEFMINGKLVAVGTMASPIVFTSGKDDLYGGDSNGDGNATQPKDQDWRSIVLNGATSSSSEMAYCLIRYGGYYFGEDAAVRAQGSNPSIHNCTFFKNHKSFMAGGNAAPSVSDCLFDGITEMAISISLASSPVLSNNTYTGNGVNGLGIVTGTYSTANQYTLRKINPATFPFPCYVIDDDITLNAGVQLTIEPGVIIKFKKEYKNYVFKGALIAEGNASEPIIFTSIHDDQSGNDANNNGSTTAPTDQDWRAITVESNQSSIKYCRFRYGGYYFGEDAALRISNCSPLVENCIFYKNNKSIYAISGAMPTVRNCLFEENTFAPVYVSLSSQVNFENNNFVNNKINALGIIATTYTGTANYTIKKIEPGAFPFNSYVIDDELIVENTINVTIEPGVIIKFSSEYKNCEFRGQLHADGTPTEPIIFTSIRDDGFGGDSNNDGAATLPSYKDWDQVTTLSDQVSFKYCQFRYGGYYFGDDAALWLNGSNALVENCTFYRTEKAVGLLNGAAPTIRNCIFQETILTPISLTLSTSTERPVLENNQFINNSINAVGLLPGTFNTAGVYQLYKMVDNTASGNTPYYLDGDIIIGASATLNIEAGVILKVQGFDYGSGIILDIKGKITALGTENDPIIFTSNRDDAHGGDTNNDGSTTEAGHGDWLGVVLTNSSGSAFNYCQFYYGGFDNQTVDIYGVIRCLGAGNPVIDHCIFDYNSKGIVVGNGASPMISNCSFMHSGWTPIGVYLGAQPAFNNITFTNNFMNAVGLEGGNFVDAGNFTLEKLSAGGIDNIPYYLHQDLTLGPNVQLSIAPGVIIKFAYIDNSDNISITVQGSLIAGGSNNAPIVFTAERDDQYGGDTNNDGSSTSPDYGDWYGILTANDNTSSTFSNCLFRYGGYYSYSNNTYYGAIRALGHSKPEINNCRFEYNSDGVAAADFSEPHLADNTFIDCGWVAVSMALTANPTFENNSIDNLTIRAIGLESKTYADAGNFNLPKRQFAGDPNIPYLVRNWITLETGFNWTLAPGVVIKMYKQSNDYYNNRFVVRGSIKANGTLGEPIVFTSYFDDEFGGDITNNGNSTGPAIADWLGVLLYNSTNSNFDHCKFRYGGYSSQSPQYGVLRLENSSPSITRCEFSDNTRAVVCAGASTVVNLDSCHLFRNRIGLRKEAGVISIHNSNIYDNIDFGVQNATTVDVDARANWWGAASGPLHPVKNPGGAGNKVSDYVLFEPWQQQKVTYKNDLAVTAILQPVTGCNLGSQEILKATISNLGSEAQTGFDVSVIVNGVAVFTENVDAFSLPPLASADYTFQHKLNLSAFQEYTIEAATALNGDQNIFNNLKSVTITNYPAIPSGEVFNNLVPADDDQGIVQPVLFSWGPITNAQVYDLYIWPATGTEPVTPTVSNISSLSYTYTGQLTFGALYKWRVKARNPCSSLAGPVQQFRVKSLPDLIVQQIQVPGAPYSGQSIEITWQTVNQGTNNTGAIRWYDALFLSIDPVLNVNTDTYLGAVYNDIALNPGEGFTQMGTVTLPNGIENQFYLFVVSDYFNYLQEFDEQNNNAYTTLDVSLTPPPDLQVTSVIAPFNAFSEQFINLSYTVVNLGTGPTVEGVWKDRIYLYDQEDLNTANAKLLGTFSHSGNLAPNQGYTRSEAIGLPNGVFGKYFIHVKTDLENKVFEHAFETNNVGRSDTIDITLTPPPDLQVSAVAAPLSAGNREQVVVRWTVNNNGASSAHGNWYDQIYISSAPILNAQAIKLYSEWQVNRDIAPGASYTDEQEISIPAAINGEYYFFVVTDFTNTIFEFNHEDNNSGRSSQPTTILSPDLVINNFSAPATASSGQTIQLNWQAGNAGPGLLTSVQRKDKIYLSNSPVLSIQQAQLLDSLEYSGGLLSGQNTAKQKSTPVPNGLGGNYYLHILTDADNKVFENGLESNNTATQAIAINLSPWPDLRPNNISGVPFSIMAGSTINLQYTVQNYGAGAIVNKTWKDRLYLSTSDTWAPGAAKPIYTFDLATSVTSNGAYTRSTGFVLPMLAGGALSGVCYLYIVADVDNNIYEHTAEGNNVLRSIPILVSSPPPVDLNLFALQSAIGDTAQSGQQVQVRWCVRNDGSTTALWDYPFWYDALYLSHDDQWSGDDLFVTDWTEAGPLDAQVMYQDIKTFTIPPGLSGKYYFLMVADHKGLMVDVNQFNNVLALNEGNPVYLRKLQYSDLNISSFSIPATATAGQPIPLTWTVQNAGAGSTLGMNWADKVYLSSNTTLENDDPILSTVQHSGALAPGAAYPASANALAPIQAAGNYVLWIKTDANQAEYEEPSETNNLVSAPIQIIAPPPADLTVVGIEHPDTAVVGALMPAGWLVKNEGINPANGVRTDIVYLSKDEQWDLADIPLGEKTLTGNLPPGAQEKLSMDMQVPGVESGDYYLITLVDALNNILEQNDTNNIGISGGKIHIKVGVLPIGIHTPALLANQQNLYYRIAIPDSLTGETMLITLQADSLNNVNELYLAYGKMPTRSTHDFSAVEPFKSDQQLIVPQLKGGDYYLLTTGYNAGGSNQSIDLLAQILPFEIRTVNAPKGGNTGTVTVKVNGGKFEADMEWTLHRQNGATIYAKNSYLINATQAFVTFDLGGAELGFYDITARKSTGAGATLTDGFEVISGSVTGDNASGSSFVCSIENTGTDELISVYAQHPPNTRRNRVVAINIQYANTGNIDLPTPTRFIFSLAGAPIALDPVNLDLNEKELLLEFTEKNGPPGILRPGASGTITVYTKAVAPLRFYLTE